METVWKIWDNIFHNEIKVSACVETVWKKRNIMARYKDIEKVDDYISLATVNGIYQARIKISEKPRKWKWTSTKVKKDGTSKARNKSINIAHRLQSDYEHRIEKGLELKRTSFIKFSNSLINDWRRKAQINESLYEKGNYDYSEYERIEFGKVMSNGDHSVWRMNTYSQYRKAIKEFQTFLISKDEENIAINDIDQSIWSDFIDWRNKTQPRRRPSTLSKYKTAMNKVFKVAKQRNQIEGYKVDFSYAESKSSKGNNEFQLESEDVKNILTYAKQRAIEVKEERKRDWHIYYQFYLWLGMVITTGIRPPSKPHTQILDKHYKERKGFAILERKNMKGITYDAVPMKGFKYFYDEALKLKEEYKVKSPFTICHLENSGTKVKGKPILTFTKQKKNLLEALNIPLFVRPYEFRDYYITTQIDNGVTALQVARACGTSLAQIDKVYYARKLSDEASIEMANSELGFEI